MPAAPFIAAIAVGSGAAAALGTAIAATITTATISTAVATAIGSGVISAGIAVASGAKASDVLKSAVIGGVASYVGASVASSVTSSVANAAAGNTATSSIAASLGKVAGSMAGGGVSSAVGSVLSGKGDPIEALIKGGLTAGLSAGVLEGVRATLSNVPGFDKYDTATGKTVKGDAPVAVQRAVTAGLAAGAMGKDADKAVLNSLLSTGTDYLSRGIKDLSATLKTSYDNAVRTGETLERNVKRQDEIVKDYNSTAEAIEARRATLQADLDKHNAAKDGYDNYDAKLRRDGYEMIGGDEYSAGYYAKYVGGRTETISDGEGGTYTQRVGGRWETAPSRDDFLNEANKYATKVNDAIPGYEAERAKVETKLTNLAGELDTLKAELPTLEQTLVQQRTALDNTVTEFQKQEELNAQLVAKTYNDTVTAKAEVEQALGAPITQEQLDAFVQTGDVAAAARDYIDIKTTDLAEAQAAALAEGYRFDPNDPEMAARFLGVKDEAETLAAVRSFADARATTVQEATDLYTQAYADIYGPDADIPAPTEEDLLAFMPQVPTDVSSIPEDYQSVAEDVVKGRIQDTFSQDLGFDDYADRTYAQESLGQERPDADYWGQFKGTSGVVGMEDSDIAPVQFGATNKAATFIPQAEENDFVPQDTYAASDYGPFLPDDPRSQVSQPTDNQFGFDTFGQFDLAESQPPADQFGFDQPSFAADDFSTPTDFDVGVAEAAETPEFGLDTAGVGDVTADIPGVQTAAAAAVEPPTFGEPALPDTQLSTAPVDLMESDFGIASAPADTSAVSNMLDYGRDQGVQTAAFQPSNIMSDTDNVGDIGLRSLVTTQQGGTSGTADDAGIASLTDQNLTETTKPELEATTKGSATYSALTDQDPTKTIAGSILDDESDDVRGGIQSGALYSGAEDEFGASNTLTAKYLNEPTKGQETEDVGLTRSLGTGNDTYTYAEPRPTDELLRDTSTGADADKLDQFLSPLRTEKTTLPVSQQPARVTPTDLEKNMDEDFDWDAWDRAAEEYYNDYDAARNLADMDTGTGGVETLQLPEGAEPDASSNLPDYGEGWVRNLGEGSQEFTTENGKVIYYDDGRVETFDNDGRYVMYGPDGSMVDYANINDPNARVQTFGPGANGRPSGTYEGGKFTPGTTRPAGGTGKSTGADKLANAITNKLLNPKALAALGGAALGAASKPKGIDPRGLRSIAAGGGPKLTQTGAKGTGGKGTVRYFEKKAAGGSIDGYAKGGGLGYLKSAHDGMEDKINATIDNKRPAKLSGGEFVIPADVVSHLGNGNSEAGAKQLYDLMERVRKARTGNSAQGKQINPKKYLPK